jgi:hypothetical protein
MMTWRHLGLSNFHDDLEQLKKLPGPLPGACVDLI